LFVTVAFKFEGDGAMRLVFLMKLVMDGSELRYVVVEFEWCCIYI